MRAGKSCTDLLLHSPWKNRRRMQEVPDIHGQDKDPSHLLRWQKLDLQLYLYILYMKSEILKAVFPKVL